VLLPYIVVVLFEQEVFVRDGCAFPKLFLLESELCRGLLLVRCEVSAFADVEEVEKDDAAEVGLALSKCWSCSVDRRQVLEDGIWDGNCLFW
jgi:hypothetical protein